MFGKIINSIPNISCGICLVGLGILINETKIINKSILHLYVKKSYDLVINNTTKCINGLFLMYNEKYDNFIIGIGITYILSSIACDINSIKKSLDILLK